MTVVLKIGNGKKGGLGEMADICDIGEIYKRERTTKQSLR